MNLSEEASEFLTQILDTPAPTGMEMDAQRIWAAYIAPFTDEQHCDAYGSTWALLRAEAPDAPTLMLDAHADEIGFSIRYIEENGFARVERLGGSDVAIARGRRIRFQGTDGEVIGDAAPDEVFMNEDVVMRSGIRPPEIFQMGRALDCRAACYTLDEFLSCFPAWVAAQRGEKNEIAVSDNRDGRECA